MFDCDIPSNACSRDLNLSALDSSPCFACGALFTLQLLIRSAGIRRLLTGNFSPGAVCWNCVCECLLCVLSCLKAENHFCPGKMCKHALI